MVSPPEPEWLRGGLALRKLLERQIWLIPLVFALLVGSVGWSAYRTLESSTHAQLAAQLQTVLDADVTALRIWVRMQQAVIRDKAMDPRVRELAAELARVARSSERPAQALRASPAVDELDGILRQTMREQEFVGYRVIERFGMQLAAEDRGLVGTRLPGRSGAIERALAGEVVVSRPVRGAKTGEDGSVLGAPMLFSLAPLADEGGEIFAVLAFGIDAEVDFTRILRVARMGESGETYAFDENGTMLSESRFNDELVAIGLLPDGPDPSSIMNVEIRDPGGNLTEGHVAQLPLRARPLTRMAAEAVTGTEGHDTDPYRDYRGVPVIGAWTWIPELAVGIGTEIDAAEAYAGLRALEMRFLAVMGVLVLGTLGMFLYSGVLVRMRGQVDRARRLGRYRIEEKIGEGGMGEVYRARHALMRRPTAIKLLRTADPGSEAVKRFEREVQVTSSLTHPNTIAIYDYGHTPEGVFYYAMEYLEGANASQVVEFDGALPEARVIHIMRPACGSIAEAHAAGLIHRDIKPQNLMLCERGGLFDFVKVLDFGLVRQSDSQMTLTNVQALTGTPLYLSPEALEAPDTIDARSDLYQLGAVAYFLLTGRHVFTGETVVDVLSQHLNSKPIPPSEVLQRPVSSDLEALILACLEKDRDLRPESAARVLAAFEAIECEGEWTQEMARQWWQRWIQSHPDVGTATAGSLPSGYTIDLGERTTAS